MGLARVVEGEKPPKRKSAKNRHYRNIGRPTQDTLRVKIKNLSAGYALSGIRRVLEACDGRIAPHTLRDFVKRGSMLSHENEALVSSVVALLEMEDGAAAAAEARCVKEEAEAKARLMRELEVSGNILSARDPLIKPLSTRSRNGM